MSRPQRVSDEIEQTKLKKPQIAAIKELVDSNANLTPETIVGKVKTHCNTKNIKYLAVKADTMMGNPVITVILKTAQYSFKIGRTKVEEAA